VDRAGAALRGRIRPTRRLGRAGWSSGVNRKLSSENYWDCENGIFTTGC
jgi:hypothetical protein